MVWERVKWPVLTTFIIAFIIVFLAFWVVGKPTLEVFWRETDKFGLLLSLVNLGAVVTLWFFQVRNEWVAQLPKLLTVVLEKPNDAGVHVVVPYLPLTGESDIRAQAQTVLTGWYDVQRLPLENIVYAVDEQGVFVDSSGRVNGGKPALFFRVRIRLTKQNEDTQRLEGRLLIQPHVYLTRDVGVRMTYPLENDDTWKEGDPQPLPTEGCEAYKNEKNQCRSVWLITRHPVAVEWLKAQLDVAPERVEKHLDEALLDELKKTEQGSVCIIGNLPLHLALAVQQAGGIYVNLDLNVPPEWRGRELSLEAFEQCDPKLHRYEIVEKGEPTFAVQKEPKA